MALNPAFAATPRTAIAQVATANTNRDGTGTIATVLTAAAAGSKIEEVVVEATTTTTNGTVRLFISLDAGTTWRLYDEIQVSAVTPSGTTPAFRVRRIYDNLLLPNATALLGASTNNAETFNVVVHGGDF